LKVSAKALSGKKKQINTYVQELGIGQKIHTSHTERLNGTIRGRQARLARRARNSPRLENPAIIVVAVAGFVQLDEGTLHTVERDTCDGDVPDQPSMDGVEVYFVSGSCRGPSTSGLGRAA
jgi:hypothetical protein